MNIFKYIEHADAAKVKKLIASDPSVLASPFSNDPKFQLKIPLIFAQEQLANQLIPLLHDTTLKYAIENNVGLIFKALIKHGMLPDQAIFQTGDLKGTSALQYAKEKNPAVAEKFERWAAHNKKWAKILGKDGESVARHEDKIPNVLLGQQRQVDDHVRQQQITPTQESAPQQQFTGSIHNPAGGKSAEEESAAGAAGPRFFDPDDNKPQDRDTPPSGRCNIQ